MIAIHMKTTKDTEILSSIFSGMDCTVFENPAMDEKNVVLKAIAEDDGPILLMGHGDPRGLYNRDLDGLFIDSGDCDVLRGKPVIGVFCYASEFADMNGLEGFFTSMFISNREEADNIFMVTDEDAIESWNISGMMERFCKRMNCLIRDGYPMNEWVDLLQESCDMNNPVERYNYEALGYFGKDSENNSENNIENNFEN